MFDDKRVFGYPLLSPRILDTTLLAYQIRPPSLFAAKAEA